LPSARPGPIKPRARRGASFARPPAHARATRTTQSHSGQAAKCRPSRPDPALSGHRVGAVADGSANPTLGRGLELLDITVRWVFHGLLDGRAPR
jgi:hypothetical protein